MPNSNEPSAGAIDQSVQSKEQLEDLVIEAFDAALEARDYKTAAHSKRVCAFAIALCRAMGMQAHEIAPIARGAFLNDIGKMSMPDEILRKPGTLTPEEQSVMREHPIRGYQIVRRFPFLSVRPAEIILTHHEWWDGRGYPNGLKEKSIPLGARIVAVAEAFDCISSDLPYRSAQPFSSAWKEISDWSGKQFDPDIVEVALRIPEGLWSELRRDIDYPRMPVG